MKRILLISVIWTLLFAGCKKENLKRNTSIPGQSNNSWLIDDAFLRLSHNSKDNIQSMDYPQFATTYTVLLDDSEIVYSYRYGNHVKLYPQHILASHEIVNDRIGDHYFCITYCPLTSSAIAWDREINGSLNEFGVSGHLYHNNLIAYDRNSDEYWSQMYTLNINGSNSGDRLGWKQLTISDWIIARNSFPGSLVLLPDSSHVCNDSTCNVPGDIRNSSDQNIYGVIDQGLDYNEDQVILFQQNKKSIFTQLKEFSLGKRDGFIIQNADYNVYTAFYYSYVGQNMVLSEEEVPITFSDEKGNTYDITGYAISGPDRGVRLESPLNYSARIFAWEGFYQGRITWSE